MNRPRRLQQHRRPVWLAVLLVITTFAFADSPTLQKKTRVHAFHQCTDKAQQTFDKELHACNLAAKDHPERKSDGCEKTAIEKYERLLAACPVDPRAKP